MILSLVGMGKEWADLVFLHPDNHLHKADNLSCQGGERMGRPSFPHPLKSKVCLHIHDRVRLILSESEWGKNGPAQFSPPAKKQRFLHIQGRVKLILSLVRVGKEWAGPVFPHPLKSKGCICIHDRVEKEWTSIVFFHPDNHLHKVDALSCQSGERMRRPSFSPPPKKQRLFAYS